MSSSLKPIKVYSRHGPNPAKVVMILDELNLPYEVEDVPFSEVKSPAYTAVNPNGRLPAIYDPNFDLTLWESGAIIEYLVDKYDTENKLSYPKGSKEDYQTKQWLYYQVSGQGPYFGQAVWFLKYHPEKLQSAIDRYVGEIKRVTAVIEGHLEKQKAQGASDGPWLVGNKITYADIAFYMWQAGVAGNFLELISFDDYPNVKEWVTKIGERPAVKDASEKAKP